MVTNPTAVLQKENARLQAENESLSAEVRDLREFVRSLNELMIAGDRVTSNAEILPLLKRVLRQALKLLNTPDGTLFLVDEDNGQLVFQVVEGRLEKELTGYRIPLGEGIVGWVARNREAVMLPDVRRDNRFSHMIDDAFKFSTQSLAAAPIVGNHRVFGVIEALNKPGDEQFSENDAALLGLFCRGVGAVLADIEQRWLDE